MAYFENCETNLDEELTKTTLEIEYTIRKRISQSHFERLRPKFKDQMIKIVSGIEDKRFINDPRQIDFADFIKKQKPFNLKNCKNTASLRRLQYENDYMKNECSTKSQLHDIPQQTHHKMQLEWKQTIAQKNKTIYFNNEIIPVIFTESLERPLSTTEMKMFAYRISTKLATRAMHYKRFNDMVRYYNNIQLDEMNLNTHLKNSIPSKLYRILNFREAIEIHRSDDNTHSYFFTLEQELALDSDGFIANKDLMDWWDVNGLELLNVAITNSKISIRTCEPMPLNIDERWVHTLYHNFNYRPITIYRHKEKQQTTEMATNQKSLISSKHISENDKENIISLRQNEHKTFLAIKLDGTKYLGIYYNNNLIYISNNNIKSSKVALNLYGCYVISIEEIHNRGCMIPTLKIIDILGVITMQLEQYTFLTKEDLFCGGPHNANINQTSRQKQLTVVTDNIKNEHFDDSNDTPVIGGSEIEFNDDFEQTEPVIIDIENCDTTETDDNVDNYIPISPDYQDLSRFNFDCEAGDFGTDIQNHLSNENTETNTLTQYVENRKHELQQTIWLNSWFIYTPINHITAIEYMNIISLENMEMTTKKMHDKELQFLMRRAKNEKEIIESIKAVDIMLNIPSTKNSDCNVHFNYFIELDEELIPQINDISLSLKCLTFQTKNDGFLLFQKNTIYKIKQHQTIELMFNTIKLINQQQTMNEQILNRTKRKTSTGKKTVIKKKNAIKYGDNDSFITIDAIKNIKLNLDNNLIDYLECSNGPIALVEKLYNRIICIDWSSILTEHAECDPTLIWQNWIKNEDCPFIKIYPILEFQVEFENNITTNDNNIKLKFLKIRADKFIADSKEKILNIINVELN